MKYANDDIVQEIRSAKVKKEVKDVLEIVQTIQKVADMIATRGTTDSKAGQYGSNKKISQDNITSYLGRSPSWVTQCVEAAELLETKQNTSQMLQAMLDGGAAKRVG
jgi:hypothetical protein